MQWSARSPLPRLKKPRTPPYALRLLLAAALAAGLFWWLRGQPPPTYDLRLVERCLKAEGADVRRTAPLALSIDGTLAVRLDSDHRLASHSDDGRVHTCLDRLAGQHLR